MMLFLWTLTGGSITLILPSLFQSCNFVINIINKKYILPKTLKKLFDHVVISQMALKYNKLPNGVLNCYLPGYYGETLIGKTCRIIIQILNPLIWTLNLIICFLTNMIPFVGPFLVILIRSSKSGFSKHHRYFQLKGYTNSQIYFIWKHDKYKYFMFGVITLLLESIPIFGYIFIFSNTIGAAFWAVDTEKRLCQLLLCKFQRKENDDLDNLENLENISNG